MSTFTSPKTSRCIPMIYGVTEMAVQECYLELSVSEYCKRLNNISYAGNSVFSANCLVMIRGRVIDGIVNITTSRNGESYVVYVDDLCGNSLGRVRPADWNEAKTSVNELYRENRIHSVVRINFDPA